ncbi:MAG: hypothetical protein PHV06_08820 [bacterium]|nr:hypothetical protein [bacterium]
MLLIIFLVVILVFISIGIYISLSKSPFKKKNLWKTGMVIGVIFITITGIIPLIIAYIQEAFFGYPQWGLILAIPLFIPILILDRIFGTFEYFGVIGNLVYFIITSFVLYGGGGAFLGYIIGLFISSGKKEN